jgi:LacI family transcriptional regulator
LSRITIKDIAKTLNINPSTVSRALRNHPDVSGQLRATIKKLADELGYRPNHMAVHLRSGKSLTIGLIIPEISMYFFPSIIKAVEEEAHARGYNLLVLHSNDSIDREIENAIICARMGVDGILVSLSRESSDLEHFQEHSLAGMPIVYFDKVLSDTNTHKVVVPGHEAAVMAMRKLLDLSPRQKNIYGIFGDPRLSITRDRMEGFTETLKEKGIEVKTSNILHALDPDEAARHFDTIYRSKPRPDGLFVMSDEILSGVLQAASQLKASIPRDIAIVSISDGYLPNLVPYGIPYVQTSGYLLGKTASKLLFNLIMEMPILPDTHFIDIKYLDNKSQESNNLSVY